MSLASVRRQLSAIREIISRRTGLWVGPTLERRVASILSKRLAVGSYRGISEYYHFLRDDPFGSGEIAVLASLLTTRTARPMNAAPEPIREFAQARLTGGGRLAVLAVGTAAAEEIYSVAVAVGQAGIDITSPAVTLTAADSDLNRLLKGSDGVYSSRALADVHVEAVEEYFDPLPARRYRVRPAIRERVQWLYADPQRGWSAIPSAVSYDLIICREWLNYLTLSALETWNSPGDRLAPGGVLICDRRIEPAGPLAVSLSGNYWIYAKSRGGACPPSFVHDTDAGRPDAALTDAARMLASRNAVAATRHLSSAIDADPFNASYQVAMAFALLQQKELEQARSYALAALSLAPHSPYALLSCGIACEKLDGAATAKRFYRKALLVRPKMAAARLHLCTLRGEEEIIAKRLRREEEVLTTESTESTEKI